MILTRLGHACLLIETSSTRILIDPGGYSDSWHGLTDLDAILITHQHHDHVDPHHIGTVIGANPQARLLAETGTVELLGDHSPDPAEVGDRFELGEVAVEVVGGEHAVIHDRIPRIGNAGFILRETGGPTFFHPGDAYTTTPSGIDLLGLPLSAPWARVAMTVDFANAVKPGRVVPIHDSTLSEAGRPTYMRMCRSVIDDSIEIDDPPHGEPYQV